jgi:glutamyl-tRNA synthetase
MARGTSGGEVLNGDSPTLYRGRIAPSPTGFLHLGHARTFWTAQERARASQGALVLRNEDLDRSRCRPEFVLAMFEDLKWFGFEWNEGPDSGGPFAPYTQSERISLYRASFDKLRERGCVYPCSCSRQEVLRTASAPHAEDDEPIYPGNCRPESSTTIERDNVQINWRFRVPDGESISFDDGHCGTQKAIAGKDFGDFVVWRHDDIPAYQLAVVVDDAAMQISEVVRGEDLLRSTFRQLLLYRALGLASPSFYHCALMKDETGRRLAKRHDSLSLRTLREKGIRPEDLRKSWENQD